MRNVDDFRRERMPQYVFEPESTPQSEWIGMTETHRIPGSPSRLTVWKWRTKGVLSRTRHRVKLPTFLFSGREYTTLDAYNWFVRAQQK